MKIIRKGTEKIISHVINAVINTRINEAGGTGGKSYSILLTYQDICNQQNTTLSLHK